jgi:hypothetical protein
MIKSIALFCTLVSFFPINCIGRNRYEILRSRVIQENIGKSDYAHILNALPDSIKDWERKDLYGYQRISTAYVMDIDSFMLFSEDRNHVIAFILLRRSQVSEAKYIFLNKINTSWWFYSIPIIQAGTANNNDDGSLHSIKEASWYNILHLCYSGYTIKKKRGTKVNPHFVEDFFVKNPNMHENHLNVFLTNRYYPGYNPTLPPCEGKE